MSVMKKIKEDPIFNNPCKYCLKRPLCNKYCKDYKNYRSNVDIIIFLIITTILICLSILISIIVLKKIYLISICYGCIYLFYTHKFISETSNDPDFLKFNIFGKMAILIIFPWGFITGNIFNVTNLDKKLDAFVGRFVSF